MSLRCQCTCLETLNITIVVFSMQVGVCVGGLCSAGRLCCYGYEIPLCAL